MSKMSALMNECVKVGFKILGRHLPGIFKRLKVQGGTKSPAREPAGLLSVPQ